MNGFLTLPWGMLWNGEDQKVFATSWLTDWPSRVGVKRHTYVWKESPSPFKYDCCDPSFWATQICRRRCDSKCTQEKIERQFGRDVQHSKRVSPVHGQSCISEILKKAGNYSLFLSRGIQQFVCWSKYSKENAKFTLNLTSTEQTFWRLFGMIIILAY